MESEQKTNQQNGQQQRSAVWQAFGFAWDFGIVVVIPLVVLGIGGRLLDKQFGTHPWIFLSGVVVSIILSTVLLIVRLQKIISRVTKPNNPPPTKPS